MWFFYTLRRAHDDVPDEAVSRVFIRTEKHSRRRVVSCRPDGRPAVIVLSLFTGGGGGVVRNERTPAPGLNDDLRRPRLKSDETDTDNVRVSTGEKTEIGF